MPVMTAVLPRTPALPTHPDAPLVVQAEPPVVKVTIGRVVVKAVLPPPTPARPTPVAASQRPALTLEAYVQARNEGKL